MVIALVSKYSTIALIASREFLSRILIIQSDIIRKILKIIIECNYGKVDDCNREFHHFDPEGQLSIQ